MLIELLKKLTSFFYRMQNMKMFNSIKKRNRHYSLELVLYFITMLTEQHHNDGFIGLILTSITPNIVGLIKLRIATRENSFLSTI